MSVVVAAVDCGTNSIRLLVARADGAGRLVDLHREMRVVRLGQGFDATGRFADEAVAEGEADVEEEAPKKPAKKKGLAAKKKKAAETSDEAESSDDSDDEPASATKSSVTPRSSACDSA